MAPLKSIKCIIEVALRRSIYKAVRPKLFQSPWTGDAIFEVGSVTGLTGSMTGPTSIGCDIRIIINRASFYTGIFFFEKKKTRTDRLAITMTHFIVQNRFRWTSRAVITRRPITLQAFTIAQQALPSGCIRILAITAP